MTRQMSQRLSLILMVVSLTGWLALAAITFAQDDTEAAATEEAAAAAATAEPAAPGEVDLYEYPSDLVIAIEPTGENGYCTICHNQPQRTIRLQDGTILNLFVNPEMVEASVHGPTDDSPGLGCLDCHGADAFPHVGPPPADGRQYTLDAVELCTSCHVGQGEDLQHGLHAQAIEAGNVEAAVCTDCHGAHHIQSAENRPELVAGVCGDCHETTLAEWQVSPHADMGPLGCATCHNYHAQTLRVGESSTELCLNCHGDMPDVYPHETHINATSEVACADCHMYTGSDDDLAQTISTLDMASTGHSMMMDTAPCTTCHAEMTESGEWADILNARFDGAPAAAEAVTPADEEAHAADAGTGNLRFVLQGLLAGLGLGITFTIVFVTRNQRS